MNMRGIIAPPLPLSAGLDGKSHFIATIIMELSAGVTGAFNEIKGLLPLFHTLIKRPT